MAWESRPATHLHLFQLFYDLIIAFAHTKQTLDGIRSTRQLLAQPDDLQHRHDRHGARLLEEAVTTEGYNSAQHATGKYMLV